MSDYESEQIEAIQNVVDRVSAYQDGATEVVVVEELRKGFTSKYGVHTLVWYEVYDSRHAAFRRERQIKEWKRVWKLELIEKSNPGWIDLLDRFFTIDSV